MRPLLPLVFLCACLLPTEAEVGDDTAKTTGGDDDTAMCDFYEDLDADGFGNPSVINPAPCDAQPDGTSPNADDCDDGSASSFPEAPESCDDQDNDCDGQVDEDPQDALPWFEDGDGDGYGAAGTEPVLACERFDGRVDNAEDCDDRLAAVNPDADEVCDGIDNNCDAATDDDSAIDRASWYEDLDGDFFGTDESLTLSCVPPEGSWVSQGGDCDDYAPTVNPGQSQYFQGDANGSYDYNCDGVEEQQYPDPGTCDNSSGSCVETEGFYLAVPDCGSGGLWLRSCDASCLPRTSGDDISQRCR